MARGSCLDCARKHVAQAMVYADLTTSCAPVPGREVHIGQAIKSQTGAANTVMYFVNTTFNYPTMAEAYRVAALNGLNRLF